jgi:hypothetical protein
MRMRRSLLISTLLCWCHNQGPTRAQEPTEPAFSASCIHDATTTPMHFAVVMSVFARPEDPQFYLPQMTSLAGLAAQTYTDWTLILVGDGLLTVEIARVFRALDDSMIPRHKVLFQNLAAELREKNVYKDVEMHSNCTVWCFAGINALNTGLHLAADMRSATHIARLDDDDQWLPHHLRVLADAYQSYPAAGFIHTQSQGELPHPHWFPAHPQGAVVVQPPQPCSLIHASASWSLHEAVGALRYRQQHEQLQTARTMTECCWGMKPCPQVLAADADMWERVWSLVQSKKLIALFAPQHTVLYTNAAKKAQLLEKIAQDALQHAVCT